MLQLPAIRAFGVPNSAVLGLDVKRLAGMDDLEKNQILIAAEVHSVAKIPQTC
jgi:hypothetical protein